MHTRYAHSCICFSKRSLIIKPATTELDKIKKLLTVQPLSQNTSSPVPSVCLPETDSQDDGNTFASNAKIKHWLSDFVMTGNATNHIFYYATNLWKQNNLSQLVKIMVSILSPRKVMATS